MPEGELLLKIGPIASGAAVIADKKMVEEICAGHRETLGFDMEAHGLYAAGSGGAVSPPKVLVVKTVVDFGDRKKKDRAQPYSCYVSAQILRWLCESHFPE